MAELLTVIEESDVDSTHSVIRISAPNMVPVYHSRVAPGESTRIVEQMSEANQQWVAAKDTLPMAIEDVLVEMACECETDYACWACRLCEALAAAVYPESVEGVPEESDADKA